MDLFHGFLFPAHVIGVIRKTVPYLATGFAVVFRGDSPAKAKSANIGVEEEVEYREKLGKWRAHAKQLLLSSCFIAMLHISWAVGGVLDYFRVWAQKFKKEYNQSLENASGEERAFLGPTRLSELVTYKAVEISSKFDVLLQEESLVDVERFGCALHVLDNLEHRQQAMELIVGTVLQARAGWEFRFVRPATSFPLLLLWFVQRPLDTEDHKRQSVAKLLLDASDQALRTRHSDVAFKLKKMFLQEVQFVADTGKCPANLFAAVLALRAAMHGDTQDLEGAILENLM